MNTLNPKYFQMFLVNKYINRYVYFMSKKFYTLQSVDKKVITDPKNFDTVYSFPFIKNISLFNRLKIYQLVGTTIAVPACGVLETLQVMPNQSFLIAAYIGLTGAALLSLASLPTRNIIGFIYISNDDKHIKISSLDFWGRRKDRIINVEDWVPLLDMPSRKSDVLFLMPQLTDGTKYKLFHKFGVVLNAKKMSYVLE